MLKRNGEKADAERQKSRSIQSTVARKGKRAQEIKRSWVARGGGNGLEKDRKGDHVPNKETRGSIGEV